MTSAAIIWLGALTILLGILYFRKRSKKGINSLPGPWRHGLPFLGNILEMEAVAHRKPSKWADKYGSIFRADIGSKTVVSLSDHKLIKEAFSCSAFSGRMHPKVFDFTEEKDLPFHGVIGSEGKHWEELRCFTLKELRQCGFGKSSMEDTIMVEVNAVVDALKTEVGKTVSNIQDRLFIAVVNSLWVIMAGKRLEQNDPAVLTLINETNRELTEMFGKLNAYFFMPKLAEWFPKLTGFTKLRETLNNFRTFFKVELDDHWRNHGDVVQRDFIDKFYQEMRKATDASSAFYGKNGRDHLLALMFDLYFAGADSTSTTLTWIILYLSKHPEVQRKLQEEIDNVTGGTRKVFLEDSSHMPYTEALIAESLRLSSTLAMGIPHKALQDVEFHGFMIPKGTIIVGNSHYIHNNPKIWGDPENFRPERFLSRDGKRYKKHDALIPFSVGKRHCIGEPLAQQSLFLFTTNLFREFSFDFDVNGPDNGFEPVAAIALRPKPYSVIINERK